MGETTGLTPALIICATLQLTWFIALATAVKLRPPSERQASEDVAPAPQPRQRHALDSVFEPRLGLTADQAIGVRRPPSARPRSTGKGSPSLQIQASAIMAAISAARSGSAPSAIG